MSPSLRRTLPTLALAFALLLAALPSAAQPAAAPVEGVDYEVVADGQPLAPLAGKIEVVEVFGYWCHHCADFAPKLEAWKAKQPRDVRVTYLPLPGGPADALARAYFAAESRRVLARTHAATFRAIHDTRALPRNPTIDEMAAFHGTLGLDAAAMRAAMESPAVGDRLRPAREWALRSGVDGTPTLVINGKYRVTARTLDDTLRIAGLLVARERAAARAR